MKARGLMTWMDSKLVGVVTMNTVKLNVPILMELLEVYLPQADVSKTCDANKLKVEVPSALS